MKYDDAKDFNDVYESENPDGMILAGEKVQVKELIKDETALVILNHQISMSDDGNEYIWVQAHDIKNDKMIVFSTASKVLSNQIATLKDADRIPFKAVIKTKKGENFKYYTFANV